QGLEAWGGVDLADLEAFVVPEEEVDAGDLEPEGAGGVQRESAHLLRDLDGLGAAAAGAVRDELPRGGALHRRDAALAHDEDAQVQPRLAALLEEDRAVRVERRLHLEDGAELVEVADEEDPVAVGAVADVGLDDAREADAV